MVLYNNNDFDYNMLCDLQRFLFTLSKIFPQMKGYFGIRITILVSIFLIVFVFTAYM